MATHLMETGKEAWKQREVATHLMETGKEAWKQREVATLLMETGKGATHSLKLENKGHCTMYKT